MQAVLAIGAVLLIVQSAAAQKKPAEVTRLPSTEDARTDCAPVLGTMSVIGAPGPQGVPLRAKRRMSARMTAVLPEAATGLVVSDCRVRLHNQWCRVTWGCLSGHARMVYIGTHADPAPRQRVRVARIAASATPALHVAPDSASERATAVPPSARLDVFDCVPGSDGQDWCAVAAGSLTGWVPQKDLVF